jgi:RNA polymerase sigma factor (sigma-70 family)
MKDFLMDSSAYFPNTDQEIISQIKEGGFHRRRSEEQLFTRFSYFIREGMKKHDLSEDDAFNAYSDSVLAAIASISGNQYESRSSLKTWLFQIFYNKCVDLIRKKTTNKNSVNRSELITDRLLELSDKTRSVIQKLIDQSDWSRLRLKLSELEEKCRQILMLWSDNLSDKQIAEQLLYKTSDVAKTSRLRCLEKLRRTYKNE